MKLIFSYLMTAVVFFTIDLLWLGLIAKGFYERQLVNFLSPEVNWAAAVIFYFLFIIGIFIFAILPAIDKHSWQYALLYGGLFGFFTYATYDLTNMATLKDWPIKIVIVDIIWGIVLTASVSLSGYFIALFLNR